MPASITKFTVSVDGGAVVHEADTMPTTVTIPSTPGKLIIQVRCSSQPGAPAYVSEIATFKVYERYVLCLTAL